MKNTFLSLSFLTLGSILLSPESLSAEDRSLFNAFNNTKPQAQEDQQHKTKLSSGPTLPPPPPLDTKTLNFHIDEDELEPQIKQAPAAINHQDDQHRFQDQTPDRNNNHHTPAMPNSGQRSTHKAPAMPQFAPLPDAPEAAPKLSPEQEKQQAANLKKEQEKDQLVRFYFEDASLENLVRYIEELFNIKFFSDDDLNPTPQGGALLKGNKITFKTNKSLTRQQAWDLFLKFLDMAGLSVIETQTKGFYRITTVTNANTEVLPTFFNTDINKLPDNSLKVRYIFFVKNAALATVQGIALKLASTSAKIDTFPDLNAVIITDKAINIRSLMQVIQEFDKDIPEAMTILKLKRADAQDVATLYSSLTQAENPLGIARFLGQRAQPDSIYFPANVRMIVEPRTNALILLGPAKSLAKIEEFITKNVDVPIDLPYSPLYIYEVQYLNAANLVSIINTVVAFQPNTAAGTYGGIRDGNEFFGPVSVSAETNTGNRLIIKASERDYKKVLAIIKELDVMQPQVALEVLIVNIASNDSKSLGSQIHNKNYGQPITNVNFQTSGLNNSGPIINQTATPTNPAGSLLGNLISLATNGAADGSTYLTIGSEAAGVWGIFQVLKSYTEASVIANPFLLTTNNFPATISAGSSRQVTTGSVISAQGPTAAYNTMPASLSVQITPQISLDNSVQMSITVNLTDFSDATNFASGNTLTKGVTTSVSAKNKEIVVLGGLVKTQVVDIETKVPILGDIPLIGWLFKNKQKTDIRTNILIFVSPRILTKDEQGVQYYTLNKAESARSTSFNMELETTNRRDPIDRTFFKHVPTENALQAFMNLDENIQETLNDPKDFNDSEKVIGHTEERKTSIKDHVEKIVDPKQHEKNRAAQEKRTKDKAEQKEATKSAKRSRRFTTTKAQEAA